MQNISRRSLAAGLALAPLAGLPALAGVVAADPALEAVAKYERLHAVEKAAWEASSAADKAILAVTDKFEHVLFNGECVFSSHHLETMRESTIGMTDEELEDTIERIRKGTARQRAEGADLEAEYQNARAVLEAREACRQEVAETSAVIDAERAAQEAQEKTNEMQRAVFETKPTTLDGAVAMLRFIAGFVDEDDVINDRNAVGLIGDAIRGAVAIMDREARA
jgi:hypothetical protein